MQIIADNLVSSRLSVQKFKVSITFVFCCLFIFVACRTGCLWLIFLIFFVLAVWISGCWDGCRNIELCISFFDICGGIIGCCRSFFLIFIYNFIPINSFCVCLGCLSFFGFFYYPCVLLLFIIVYLHLKSYH